jgi:peptidoglycan/LPS O-acetylase OafA/YrhL
MAIKGLSFFLFTFVVFSTNAVLIGLLARRRRSTRRMLFLGAISTGLSFALVVVFGLLAYQRTPPFDLGQLAAYALGAFFLVSLSVHIGYFLYSSWIRATKELEERERRIALGATDLPAARRNGHPYNSATPSSPSDRVGPD